MITKLIIIVICLAVISMTGCSVDNITTGKMDPNAELSSEAFNEMVNTSLYILASIIGVIILLFVYLKHKGICVKNKSITVAISITFMPILVFFLIIFYFYSIFLSDDGFPLKGLNIHILNIELTILFVYIVYKCMKAPYSKLSANVGVSRTAVSIDKTMKMFYLSIYISLIILLIILAIIIGVYKIVDYYNIDFSEYVPDPDEFFNSYNIVDILFSSLIFSIFLAVPLLGVQGLVIVILGAMVWMFFAILMVMQYAMIINATIRMKITTKSRKIGSAYLVIMLIPYLNILNCFLLIHFARKELRNEGLKLGVFGTKYISNKNKKII